MKTFRAFLFAKKGDEYFFPLVSLKNSHLNKGVYNLCSDFYLKNNSYKRYLNLLNKYLDEGDDFLLPEENIKQLWWGQRIVDFETINNELVRQEKYLSDTAVRSKRYEEEQICFDSFDLIKLNVDKYGYDFVFPVTFHVSNIQDSDYNYNQVADFQFEQESVEITFLEMILQKLQELEEWEENKVYRELRNLEFSATLYEKENTV